MSSQLFHRTPRVRIQEITAGVQFRLGIIESFDPVTQELYRQPTETNEPREYKQNIDRLTEQKRKIKAKNQGLRPNHTHRRAPSSVVCNTEE
jgi:hypothetical protein